MRKETGITNPNLTWRLIQDNPQTWECVDLKHQDDPKAKVLAMVFENWKPDGRVPAGLLPDDQPPDTIVPNTKSYFVWQVVGGDTGWEVLCSEAMKAAEAHLL